MVFSISIRIKSFYLKKSQAESIKFYLDIGAYDTKPENLHLIHCFENVHFALPCNFNGLETDRDSVQFKNCTFEKDISFDGQPGEGHSYLLFEDVIFRKRVVFKNTDLTNALEKEKEREWEILKRIKTPIWGFFQGEMRILSYVKASFFQNIPFGEGCQKF